MGDLVDKLHSPASFWETGFFFSPFAIQQDKGAFMVFLASLFI